MVIIYPNHNVLASWESLQKCVTDNGHRTSDHATKNIGDLFFSLAHVNVAAKNVFGLMILYFLSRDYFKFTFVRHPYTRILAAYRNKINPGVQVSPIFLLERFHGFRLFSQTFCDISS